MQLILANNHYFNKLAIMCVLEQSHSFNPKYIFFKLTKTIDKYFSPKISLKKPLEYSFQGKTKSTQNFVLKGRKNKYSKVW